MSASALLAALAETLRLGGQADDAAIWYRLALKLNPRLANAYTALGAIHANAGRFDEAINDFRRALEIDENFQQSSGLSRDRARRKRAARRERGHLPPNGRPVSRRPPSLMALCCSTCHFGPRSARATSSPKRVSGMPGMRGPSRHRLRHTRTIARPSGGCASATCHPDFQTHVQSLFTVPLLQNHDHRQFEIFCYSSADKRTALTERIRGYADTFREGRGPWTTRPWPKSFDAIRIDILVDLTMHMTGSRLLAFARRPAPVQLCWLAYPGTTGLEAMDYRLSDPFLDPPEADTEVYSEETIRLPDSFWCYDPLTDVPDVSSLPALAEGRITFGCLNHFRKVNAGVLRLWATVLAALPKSRLVLMAPTGSARDRVRAIFEAASVELDRIEFVDRCGRLDYLRRYHAIDVCLDTFPSNGHTTSLDALWMGVPTVTLAGRHGRRSRWRLPSDEFGLAELIATTPEEYVRIRPLARR